jgi:hypothetical protein
MRGVLDLSLLPVDNLPHAELLPSTGVVSAELDIPRLLALAEQLEGHVDAGASGVVVTTGTHTLEEVAFALDLLWDRDEPLVVVGAMRHGALPGSDGPANLRDGLRVAAHPHARGQGVLVAMGGEIHTPGRSVSPTLAHWQPLIQRCRTRRIGAGRHRADDINVCHRSSTVQAEPADSHRTCRAGAISTRRRWADSFS